ncbi:MAG: hypothetical protein LPK19_04315 [Hymenobacteraceae bacterium]|nr:hypothetical protein [Hymenobacteraceae bacterium]MDX5395420.1 hypothetical protein [Hymenobacteraceae bacterium]MDX5511469.1 hypothetical protein [Hymenobacteraceae bacterium]
MKANGTTTYKAAQAVAKTIEEQFERYKVDAEERGLQTEAPVPPAALIETIIDTAFWASLRREEGVSPKVSLVFLPPELVPQPLLFKEKLPYRPRVLTKIAPGVAQAGIHIGVWHEDGELYIWGTTSEVINFCFVLDVSEPALLVVKHRRSEGFGTFANVAVLIGDQVKIIDENSASIPDCPALLTSLLGFTVPAFWSNSVNVLILMAVQMRAHKRGGILLIVPSDSDRWCESIIQPLNYAVQPRFSGLAALMQQKPETDKELVWQTSVRQEVTNIASLTAIDGATIINDNYDLLAFGAKIGRAADSTPVEEVIITEPVIGTEAIMAHPAQRGGTRHLAAAQFVNDQHDSMALVASQDGSFTVFVWSPCEQKVHAHLLHSLLL